MELKRFRNGFTSFVTIALKPLIFILLVVSIGCIGVYKGNFDIAAVILVGVVVIAILLACILLKSKKLSNKSKLLIVLSFGALIRILWLINIKTVPVSDFNTIYETAKEVLKGDYSMMWGTEYIARFPHLTVMVMYMAFMLKFFTHALFAMKIVNLIMGIITIYLIYLIAKLVFEKIEYGIIGALIATIFPPFVTYTGVLCTENIAIPFYLASIYIFLLACKKKIHPSMFIVSGALLSVGNLFRMVATVTIVAFIMYIVIYTDFKFKEKIKSIIMVVVSFALILFIVSSTLKSYKVTENNLWKGREPAITNILKGTNMETGGRWSPEDAIIPEKYNFDEDKIKEACTNIIIDRFKNATPMQIGKFYLEKYTTQWMDGDMSGVFWSQSNVKDSDILIKFNFGGKFIIQIISSVVILLIFIGLFNKKRYRKYSGINLFYIIFCGYGLSYLITENQSRYAYIVSFAFVIAAVSGIELLGKVFKRS